MGGGRPGRPMVDIIHGLQKGIVSLAKKLSVDIASIDQQHEALATAVETLFTDHVPTRQEFLGALDRLGQDVAEHFAHEEHIMRNIGLPDYVTHTQIHHALLKELRDFRADVEHDFDERTPTELRTFLTYWLLRHIAKDDMRIRAHLYR